MSITEEDGWMPMTADVGEAMLAAGPSGYIEFSDPPESWRMHFADGTVWHGKE